MGLFASLGLPLPAGAARQAAGSPLAGATVRAEPPAPDERLDDPDPSKQETP